METFSWINAIIVFFTYIVIDMLYATYIIYVGEKKAFKAATTSSIIYSLLAYGVISYSENVLYMIPLALGAWIGTFITVRYNKH